MSRIVVTLSETVDSALRAESARREVSVSSLVAGILATRYAAKAQDFQHGGYRHLRPGSIIRIRDNPPMAGDEQDLLDVVGQYAEVIDVSLDDEYIVSAKTESGDTFSLRREQFEVERY